MQDADVVVGQEAIIVGTHGWAGRRVVVLEDCGPNACPSIIPHGTVAYKCALVGDDPSKKWGFFVASELEIPSSLPGDWSND